MLSPSVQAAAPVHVASMRAGVIAAPRAISIESIPIPQPKAGEVCVRLEGCGVCGSNLPVWQGRPWFEYPREPGSPGHEGWGRVHAVGSGVSGFELGQPVALLSYHAFAQYDVADVEAIVSLPAALASSPFPGEPLGCALNVFRRSDIHSGQSVAVVGVGFLGALLIQLAKDAGAHVLAITRRPFALSIAAQCGADELIEWGDAGDVVRQVQARTKGQGCDCVIECVGLQSSLDLASELVRERGRLVVAGYHQDGTRQVNMQSWNWRGIDVINAHERDPRVYRAGIEAAVDAVLSGRLRPDLLYTHAYPLERLAEAFELMAERPDQFLKALVMM